LNPFTQSLIARIQDRQLTEFVLQWDRLEALVIRVFKGKSASQTDETEYREVRARLQKDYPRWQPALQPYWQTARVAGEYAQEDPFAFLLSTSEASGFVKNKRAMVTLPAAREAINQFLVDRIEESNA
jgi:hypothetical protein